MCGVFRVKNHDFTPKNHIFANFRGGRAPGAPPPGSAPAKSPFKIIITEWFFFRCHIIKVLLVISLLL
jgi:hypothetical protein